MFTLSASKFQKFILHFIMKGTFCITSLVNVRETTDDRRRSRAESINATGMVLTPETCTSCDSEESFCNKFL